jgi:nucleotide-binding universal stress UspA family protein
MFQIKRILFPVDFSDRNRGAFAYVEALAGQFEAELILLHVVEPTYNSTLADLEDIPSTKFDQFFGKDLKYLRVERLTEHGDPAVRIIGCAARREVDLIMLPTQGMGLYRRLIIGSTSAKVLHDADCPVWTGVHLEDAPKVENVHCRKILCAVDFKPHSERVVDWANHLARAY